MADDQKYVVHGMRVKCSEGSMENYINTDTGHGVVYQGQPVLNANDHAKDVNLTHFGDCKSKLIFEEAKKQADEKYKAEEGEGFFSKIGKAIAKTVTKATLDIKATFASNKCELETPLPWIFTSRDHMIDGAPALTIESQCACKFGGIITVVPQEEEGLEDSSPEEKNTNEQNTNNMSSQLLTAAAGLGLSITKLGKAGIALALENMEADVRGRIHHLLNWDEDIKGNMQMALSVIPYSSLNSKAKLFQNEDSKEMDQVITKYENKIYDKYKAQFDYYKMIRDENKKKKQEMSKEQLLMIQKKFANTDIMSELEDLGEELNALGAVQNHKNDLVNFFNMVYTDNPIDLKSRGFRYPGTTTSAGISIWAAPWAKEGGGNFEADYAGNWLYGYVGAEYFATPADDAVLKYGAGAAQLLSDIMNSEDKEKAAAKYLQSVLQGNYGDNTNEGTQSDSEMIQEGVEAYRARKKR